MLPGVGESAGVVVADQIGAHLCEIRDAAGKNLVEGIAQESRGRADLKLGAVVAGALNGREHGVELGEIPSVGAGERNTI